MGGYILNRENIERLFGHEAAEREDEERLNQYYVRRSDYEIVKSSLPLKIVVGFKGVGKSALLKVSYLEDLSNDIPAIWIRPDDISELYDNLLSETNYNKLITLWKKGLSRLIACRISEDWVRCLSEEAEIAIRWAEESGYRSKDLIGQVTSKLKPVISKYIDLDNINTKISEHRILERLLNERKIRIYIDDLDRGWNAKREDIKRLSALINAIGDLTTDIKGLQIRIALRTDVYTLIRESDESTDKFESSLLSCSWTNAEVLITLVKRINTYLWEKYDEEELSNMKRYDPTEFLNPIFEERLTGTSYFRNSPIHKIIMLVVRRRPRDMVKLCISAAQKALDENADRIQGKHIIAVLENYSVERMTDLINEFNSEMGNIKKLLYNMGPTTKERNEKKINRFVYTTDELYKKIKTNMERFNITFKYNPNPDIHDIAHFLYKIGFIYAIKKYDSGYLKKVHFEEKKQLLLKHIGGHGYSWAIHPAYRSALERTHEDLWYYTLNIDDEYEDLMYYSKS